MATSTSTNAPAPARRTVMTITGIRPDFIRMSAVFKRLDEEFHHIMVHTGQHYDALMSDVFFQDLHIRAPDFVLETGRRSKTHYQQLSYLSVAIMDLIKEHDLRPDIILFLGDANTACIALPLRKEGYVIGHIEAGMRSFDKRMLEELNRTVCDHCSNILFVYTEDYKQHLANENIRENVHVVGNTITEVCARFIPTNTMPRRDVVLVDIHRPENFKHPERMRQILAYANRCAVLYDCPVKMLRFHGTCACIDEHQLDLGRVELVDLMSFKTYIDTVYHCKFLVSDSGTGQEEPALCGTPVIVPRDFTERPQSVAANCSFMLRADDLSNMDESFEYLRCVANGDLKLGTEWLGDGTAAEQIVGHLRAFLAPR